MVLAKRFLVAGREKAGAPERLLSHCDKAHHAHTLAINWIVGGYEDVTVRDTETETRWIPVPWNPRLDDDEEING